MRRNSVMYALRRLRAVQEDAARLKFTRQKLAYDVAADALRKEKHLVETEKFTQDIALHVAWLLAAKLAATEARLAMVRESAQLHAARDAVVHARFARKMIEDACAAAQIEGRAAHRAREQLAIDDLVNGERLSEPPRVCRRPQHLRGYADDRPRTAVIFAGSSRASGLPCAAASG